MQSVWVCFSGGGSGLLLYYEKRLLGGRHLVMDHSSAVRTSSVGYLVATSIFVCNVFIVQLARKQPDRIVW